MISRKNIIFTCITVILGFMLAIQFQTTQHPIVRDTRDIWEIREDINKQQELQREIIKEINEAERLLKEYASVSQRDKVEALQAQKNLLSERIGLTELHGDGLILTVQPLFTDIFGVSVNTTIPPELLARLFNELNRNGATAISIEGERIISITPIRGVNNQTYVNNSPLPPFPIEIKVLSDDVTRLHNKMSVSQALDEFALENLELTLKKAKDITIPAYDQALRIQYMEPADPTITN